MSDQQPAPPTEEHQEAPKETTHSQSKPARGGYSARGGRGRGNVKYVKKGENEEAVEENKEEEKQEYEKKPKYDKQRPKAKEFEVFTLETVVPEKPKKHDILKEPSEEEYNKKYEEISNKVDELHKKFHNYIEEVKSSSKQNKDKSKKHINACEGFAYNQDCREQACPS